MSKFLKTKDLTAIGLLIALHVVFARVLSIETGPFKISLGFIPVCVGGMIFGPAGGGAIGAVSDFIGCIIFSKGQVYFPLFTLSELLYGVGFGFILHKKKFSVLKTSLLVVLQFVALNLVLQSCWLYIYYLLIIGKQKAFFALLVARASAALVNLPVQIAAVNLISKYLRKPLSQIAG